MGRRIEKAVTENSVTTTTRYLYDNEDIIAEYNASGNITTKYIHGLGIDEPLSMEKNGQQYYYHTDGLGSVTEITNSSATVVQSYQYDSFGNIKSVLDPNFIQPFAFTGREYDPETGMYFYNARYYDQKTGNFISKDPIGFAGGINLYAYVSNNPINFVDPWGLAKSEKVKFTNPYSYRGMVGEIFMAVGGAVVVVAPAPQAKVGGVIMFGVGLYLWFTDTKEMADTKAEETEKLVKQLKKEEKELEKALEELEGKPNQKCR